MSFWSITLVVTGAICVLISLLQSRHSTASEDFIAVHKGMDDERIGSQLKQGPWRVDATLGIQFGAALIALGLLWQLILSVYWF